MPRSRGSYPHPVLDDSDDVGSNFRIRNGVVVSGTTSIELQFDVELDDPDLKHYLNSGDARLGVRWKCPSTLCLEQVTPQLVGDFGIYQRFRISMPHDRVSGTITAEPIITASRTITNYYLRKQSPDYGNATFLVQSGDVLATGGQFIFSAEKVFDPMLPPLDSCFQIREYVHLDSGFHVDTSADDYVVIGLAPTAFRHFQNLASKPEYQLATVMLPALIATLTVMEQEESSGEFQGKAWYRTLSSLIEQYNVEHEEPYKQAQKILEDPIGRSMAAEVSLLGEDEDM